MTTRKVILLFALTAVFIHNSVAQIDTTLRSFFPTNIGDYWEYMDEDFPTPTLHYYIRVGRDTTMPNGKTYHTFREVDFKYPTYIYYNYYRIDDSMKVWRYFLVDSCPEHEYIQYDITVPDRTLWPVCLDIVPGDQQEYIGLFSTQEDFFPHLCLDTLSKFFIDQVVVDSVTGDTLWDSPFFSKRWLAKGLGRARGQGEAGPVVYLIGAIINGRRYGTITSIDEFGLGQNAPNHFRLVQNFPNPFNPSTRIRYEVPYASNVTIKVYNMLGQEIATLVNGLHNPGSYTVIFNAPTLAAGVYVYRLQANKANLINKMLLIK